LEADNNVPAGHVQVYVGGDYDGPGTQSLAGAPLVGLDGARRQQQPEQTEQPITADGVRCVN
jgi:hypothetical protein